MSSHQIGGFPRQDADLHGLLLHPGSHLEGPVTHPLHSQPAAQSVPGARVDRPAAPPVGPGPTMGRLFWLSACFSKVNVEMKEKTKVMLQKTDIRSLVAFVYLSAKKGAMEKTLRQLAKALEGVSKWDSLWCDPMYLCRWVARSGALLPRWRRLPRPAPVLSAR